MGILSVKRQNRKMTHFSYLGTMSILNYNSISQEIFFYCRYFVLLDVATFFSPTKSQGWVGIETVISVPGH